MFLNLRKGFRRSGVRRKPARAELTKLQPDEQVAECIRLTDEKVQLAGLRPIEESERADGRPEGGVSAAARVLGVKRTSAHKAIKPKQAKNSKGRRLRPARRNNARPG
jgi:hypothetical protein